MMTFSTCTNHSGCAGCALRLCCPVRLDLRLHAIEAAREQESAPKRERFTLGSILGLNLPLYYNANDQHSWKVGGCDDK